MWKIPIDGYISVKMQLILNGYEQKSNKCEIGENYYVNDVTNFKVDLQLSAEVQSNRYLLLLEKKNRNNLW